LSKDIGDFNAGFSFVLTDGEAIGFDIFISGFFGSIGFGDGAGFGACFAGSSIFIGAGVGVGVGVGFCAGMGADGVADFFWRVLNSSSVIFSILPSGCLIGINVAMIN
jgi:hypothetical protein